MQRMRRSKLLLVSLLAVVVVAACGSGKKSATSGATNQKAVKGGTLTLSAEQEPDCADWIASCAGSTWGSYTIQEHTMPRAFDVMPDGSQQASALLAGAPTLETGPPQKVTYKIDPKAVWSDGQPITSTDFKYTWDQVAHGKDIYDKTGYEKIQSIDDTDKSTAVVTFSEPYADWKDLFGGFYGVFPSHLLQGKDRDTEMKNGYTWSGGPWMLDHWTRKSEIKLVRNPKYWGKQPNLDAVVFKIIKDTAAEIGAFKTGQSAAIYPQAQPELAQLKTLANTSFKVTNGLSYEALWLNNAKFPLNSTAVRQALAYATDREAIVQRLFGAVQPNIKAINAFTTPSNKKWYSDPFSVYTRDLTKVNSLMTGDGWTKGSDGKWIKNGQKASLYIRTTAGNKRRELMEDILRSQWGEAGFDMQPPQNQDNDPLFGQTLPAGDFQVGIYAQTPQSPSPAQCVTFCSKNIPTPPSNSGTNWTRTSDPKVDDAWSKADTELDETKRVTYVTDGTKALSDIVASLPLDPFPNTVVYNSAKLGGTIVDNPVYGMYWNMSEWFCKGSC